MPTIHKILQALFLVPTEIAKSCQKDVRIVTFVTEGDLVSFLASSGIRTGEKEVQVSELGSEVST